MVGESHGRPTDLQRWQALPLGVSAKPLSRPPARQLLQSLWGPLQSLAQGHQRYFDTAKTCRYKPHRKPLTGQQSQRKSRNHVCNLAAGNPPNGNKPLGKRNAQLSYFFAH